MANVLKRVVDPLGLAVSKDMGTVLITSGTGVIGHRVAVDLLERIADKQSIRVGVWKGERQFQVDASVGQNVSEELEGKGATVIMFDWTDEEGHVMALAGVKTVFFTLPYMQTTVDVFTNFVNSCKKAGVEHFCMASFLQPGGKFAGPYDQLLRQCEKVLKEFKIDSRMTYTILHYSHLMSTPLVALGPILHKEHKYITASYAMGVNYISPNDVARAVVKTLISFKKHRNKTYSLTASHPVLDKDVATYLSKFYNTDIEHVAVGYHEYEDELKQRGYPDADIKDAASMERGKASGFEETKAAYSTDLESLLGTKSKDKDDNGKDKDDDEDKDDDGEDKAKDASKSGFEAETFQGYLANVSKTMTLQENPGEAGI